MRRGELRRKKALREWTATKVKGVRQKIDTTGLGGALEVNRGAIRHMSQENGSITL